MQRLVVEFVAVMQRMGAQPVSPGELIDAVRALAAVDLGHREQVRAALGCTLVKRASDKSRFDTAFAQYFESLGHAMPNSEPAVGLGALPLSAQQWSELHTLLASKPEWLPYAIVSWGGDSWTRWIAHAGFELPRSAQLSQQGYWAHRLRTRLRVPEASTRGSAHVDSQDSLREALRTWFGGALGDAIADALHARMPALRRALHQHVAEQLEQRAPRARDDDARDWAALHQALCSDEPTHRVQREVERMMQRLQTRVQTRLQARRKRRRRCPLDVRRTLRDARRHDGVVLRVYRKKPRPRQGHWVILCDVSDSVRPAAVFFLRLAQAIQRAVPRVQVYLFVNRLVPVTAELRASGRAAHSTRTGHASSRAIERALSRAFDMSHATSDYGRVFAQLTRVLRTPRQRTHVIVLGDGRTNFRHDGREALAAVRRNVQTLYWLTPDPPATWSAADSAMREYEKYCDRVEFVPDLTSLADAVDRLFR
jgi:uncharacterized protein with von Willebrand factor type A (vWA) domain